MALGDTPVLDLFGTDGGPPPPGAWATTWIGWGSAKALGGLLVSSSPDANGHVVHRTDVSATDAEAHVLLDSIPNPGLDFKLFLRLDVGLLNGYAASFQNVNGTQFDWQLLRSDAGSFFQVGASVQQTFAPGDRLGVRIVGNTVQMWRRAGDTGTPVAILTRTESTYAGAGRIAVGLGHDALRLRDFGGGAVSAPVTPTALSGTITPALSFSGDIDFVPTDLAGTITPGLVFSGDLAIDLTPVCTYPGPNTYPGPDTYPGCPAVTIDVAPASSYATPAGVETIDPTGTLDLAPAGSPVAPAGVDLSVSGPAALDLAPANSYAAPPGLNLPLPPNPVADPRRPGGPLPWMVFGGVEIGNSVRTMAYLQNAYDANGNPTGIAGIPTGAYGWRIRDFDCCSCPVLGTDGAGNAMVFARPDDIGISVGDPAPWYDPGVPESAQFLGVLITEITGLDSTVGRSKIERAAGLGGAALGVQRAGGREINVRAVLVATSCPGLDYGRRWLSHTLANDLCDDCETYQLELRTTCPPDDRPDVGLVNLYEVGLSEGPKVVRDGGLPECCDLLEIEWTLTAGNPLMYACPVVVVPRINVTGGAVVSGTIDPPEPFGTLAAQIDVDTGTTANVSILIRAWDQLLADPCPGAAGEECLSILLSGLPAGVSVSVDGARQRLSITDAAGVVTDGLPYVVMADGRSFDWPEFVGCQRVCVAVSVTLEPGIGSPPGASVEISSQHRFLA